MMSIARRVRHYALSATAAALFCIVAAPHAQAFSVSITLDENGNGLFTNTNGFSQLLPGVLLADPNPGGLASALNYGLLNPPGLVAGDVKLTEGNVTSDDIRFDTVTSGGSLFFYSLPGPSRADKGLPTAFETNVLSIAEVSLGTGAVGAIYTPTAGQPGFVASAGGPVTYTFISDTPEPSTVLLLLLGLPVMASLRRKSQKL